MIGVKRPLKLGTPKPAKSAKKKKALQQPPKPDNDDATVIANPYADYMQQKPSESMNVHPEEIMAPPFTEVVDEGYVPNVEEMVKSIRAESKPCALEQCHQLPHKMRYRYRQLLKKANPNELIEGQPPSLTWLEERYGHLVEKEFWYDRVVKLASTYVELCEGEKDVFEMGLAELEKAVGTMVPYTEEEKEYLQLLENYKQSKVQIDGIPTLEFLRRHHSKPPKAEATTTTEEPVLPDITEAALAEALNEDSRYVSADQCPIHQDSVMRCLNTDERFGALFFKCEKPDCSVFYTTDTAQDVCHQLLQAIHPTVREGLFHTNLKCECNFTPRMKLSRSEKNFGRVFLTCFKKNNPCRYFQWIHWKVRTPKGPMDQYVKKQDPHRGRLYYTRGPAPTEVQRARQTNQQMICAHPADRFKKDYVKMFYPKPWGSNQGGFVPSQGPLNSVGHQFKNGLYVGDKTDSFESDFFGPGSSLF